MGEERTHVLRLVRQVLVDSSHDFCFSLNTVSCHFSVFRNCEECSNRPQVSLEVKLKTIDAVTQAESLIAAAVRFIEVFGAIWDFKSVSVPLEYGHLLWQVLVCHRGWFRRPSNLMPP